ncbi:hypothetical protein [Marilutibacter chinensis]|uniref:Uncharacterized protein n=1 Tax=Marilutibacter chinensis TaxID=2912247 RepID=A0ABS9HP83_9GAMM|nr:hypothetical protein [Lysobacter chinensis]MCF7220393.1 hypothetical protein [Lysobacter chinensis]
MDGIEFVSAFFVSCVLLGILAAEVSVGVQSYREHRIRRRADSEYRAAALLLWAKQHAALLKRKRAGEGIEA